MFSGWHIPFVYLMVILFSLLQLRLRQARTRAEILEIFLVHLMGIGGFSGMTSFYFHTVEADRLAESIGWPAGNPFQTEVGFANLGIGLVAFLSFWRRDFILPAIIAGGVMAVGAGIVHIIDIVQHGNFAPGNAGPILYADFLGPALRIGLYVAYARALAPGRPPEAHAGWYGS